MENSASLGSRACQLLDWNWQHWPSCLSEHTEPQHVGRHEVVCDRPPSSSGTRLDFTGDGAGRQNRTHGTTTHACFGLRGWHKSLPSFQFFPWLRLAVSVVGTVLEVPLWQLLLHVTGQTSVGRPVFTHVLPSYSFGGWRKPVGGWRDRRA